MTIESGKMITDVALTTVIGLQKQLNESLAEKDLAKAKIFKKHLNQTLKDYYGI